MSTNFSDYTWHGEPTTWSVSNGELRLSPDGQTDFWQRTHYGFQADNGHFLHRQMDGDFVLRAHVHFHPRHQYDQAGLMIRVSAECWLKCSVEFEPGEPSRLGAVVTNQGYSDWSTQNFSATATNVWLRVQRQADDYIVDFSADGTRWEQMRIAHLHGGRGRPVACGIYACSPKASGFVCEFSDVSVAAGRLAGS